MRRIRACCARAASGHAAAAPPRNAMKLRRLTGQHLPCLRKDSTPQLWQETAALRDFKPAYDRLGSFTSFQARSRHDRFTPMNGHSSGDRLVRVVPTRRHRLAIRSRCTLAANLPNDKPPHCWQLQPNTCSRADIILPAEWYIEAAVRQWPDLEGFLQPSILDDIPSARADLRRPQ